MPWRELSPMEQRLELVQEYASGLFTMTELAAQYGISRKTGYLWVDRYTAEGAAGLQDRSRRPHTSPQATDAALIEALVAQRRRHPRWGAKKLLAVVKRTQPDAAWPARSTVNDALKSVVHTSLIWVIGASGEGRGTSGRARRRRGSIKPRAFKASLTVDRAGHAVSG